MDRLSKALELARKSRGPTGSAKGGSQRTKIEYTSTKVLGTTVETLSSSRIIQALDQDSPLVDAYRLLRTRVLHRMEQNAWKTLGITSAGSGEGKTLTAINLAISIAREGRYTVMLVDADLRRPSVHRCFGLTPTRGLTDYLAQQTPLEGLLVNPGIERLVLLAGGRIEKGVSERLSSAEMHQLVADVKARYPNRIVIFDLPPVLIGDDVIKFTPQLDTLLFVVQEGATKREEIAKALELVKGHDVVGMVLNKAEDLIQFDGYYQRHPET